MQFEVGDKVIWMGNNDDTGTVKEVKDSEITVIWSGSAGTQKYTKSWYKNITVVQTSKDKSEFKTVHVVKLEDFTGTIVEYKGRKYKLSLAE